MQESLIVTALLSMMVFLLGIITYFLKKHLDRFDSLEVKVANHENRLGIIDNEITNIKNTTK